MNMSRKRKIDELSKYFQEIPLNKKDILKNIKTKSKKISVELSNLNNKNAIFANTILNIENYTNILYNETKEYLENIFTFIQDMSLRIESEMLLSEIDVIINKITIQNRYLSQDIQNKTKRTDIRSMRFLQKKISKIRTQKKRETKNINETKLDKKIAILRENIDKVKQLNTVDRSIRSFERIQQRPLSNQPLFSLQQKGGINDADAKNMIWCLEYGIPDTLHDFGDSRNGIFPKRIPPLSGTEAAKAFLKKAESFLQQSYETEFKRIMGFTDTTDVISKDKLYYHYTKNPMHFEDSTKDDFLLGNLCEDIDNVFYYFNAELPDKEKKDTHWAQIKKDFYGKNTPLGLDAFFEKTENYRFFILDACMGIQKDWDKRGTDPKLLRTMANLWDPAGAESFEKSKFTDGQNGLYLVEEYRYQNHIIYDARSVNNTNVSGTLQKIETSLYDFSYYDLMNENALEKEDIYIKIRIGIEQEKCKVAVLIYDKKEPISTPPTIFIMEYGGFSVWVLSLGLYFIETGNDYPKKEKPKEKEELEYSLLKSVIVYFQNTLEKKGLSKEEIRTKLYILLARFKSTGDHGTALSTKFMNTVLKVPTLYVSGDRLAFIYSILQEIPTIFNYYKSGKKTGSKDSDDCEIEEKERFIGTFFPDYDEVKNCYTKLQHAKTFFLSFFPISSRPPISNFSKSIPFLQWRLDSYIDTLQKIKTYFFENEKYNQSEVSIDEMMENQKPKWEQILLEIYQMIMPMDIEEAILESAKINNTNIYKELVDAHKKKFRELNKIMNSIYFIQNYKEARNIIYKIFKTQVEDLKPIISFDTSRFFNNSLEIQNARSRNALLTISSNSPWLQTIYTKIKSTLNPVNFIKILRNTKSQKENIATEYENFMNIKSKYLSRITSISHSMKELFGTHHGMIEQSRTILDEFTTQFVKDLNKQVEKDKNTNPMIPYMIDLFFGITDIAEAVPVEESEVFLGKVAREVISQPKEQKVYKKKDESLPIVQNTVKKVLKDSTSIFGSVSRKVKNVTSRVSSFFKKNKTVRAT